MPDYPLAQLPYNPLIAPRLLRMRALDIKGYLPADSKHALLNIEDVLVRSLLRLSSPVSFNDPFEMTAHFVMTSTREQREARFEALIREQMPHWGWRNIKAKIVQMEAMGEAGLRPGLERSLAIRRTEAGIYCFAGSAVNRLMWGHYASHHKGVCLTFDRALDFDVLSHAYRVQYDSKFPTINWFTDFHAGISRMLFTKDPCWRYERESRIMIEGQAGRYLAVAPAAVRALTFGCEVEQPFVDAVMRIVAARAQVKHPPIALYHARRRERRFGLVFV